MRRVALLCLALSAGAFAAAGQERDTAVCHRMYVGFSSGLNNRYGLLGVNADVLIRDRLVAGGGIGFSTWGTKLGLEGKYYFSSCIQEFAVGAGVTCNTGVREARMNLHTVDGDKDVLLELKPKTNIFLASYYYGKIGRKSRFYLALGYSFGLQETEYHNKSSHRLTESADDAIHFLAPGGIMLSLGFQFGLLEKKAAAK